MTETRRGCIASAAAGLVTLAVPATAAQSAVQRDVSALQKIVGAIISMRWALVPSSQTQRRAPCILER